MKNIAIIGFVALAIFGLWFYQRTRSRSQPAQPPQSNDAYLGLRNMALQGSREKFNLAPTSTPTEPWGVIMDWGVELGTATVVAFSDGHASVYLSGGGGFLGGEAHEAMRTAAKSMVAAAVAVQPQTRATTEYPLPQRGVVFFYLLTDAGVFTASAPEADLSAGRHPLAKLGNAAQDVITQYKYQLIPPTK